MGVRKLGGIKELAEDGTQSRRRYDWRGLNVEVAEHGIRAPATDEANQIGVDLGAEEGHRPAGAEGPSFDVGGVKAVEMSSRSHKLAEVGGDCASEQHRRMSM